MALWVGAILTACEKERRKLVDLRRATRTVAAA